MVPADHYAIARNANLAGDLKHEVRETGRGHSGIAAVLIHLIGCGLDQHRRLRFASPKQCGSNYVLVGRATRPNARMLPSFISCNDFLNAMHDSTFPENQSKFFRLRMMRL